MKLIASLVTAAALFVAGPAFADGSWDATHPRRDQVNDRLARQHARIDAGVRDGQLTHHQARVLHREDHAVRREERAMASLHGGHITRGEQRMLDRQEDRISRRIGRERARGR